MSDYYGGGKFQIYCAVNGILAAIYSLDYSFSKTKIIWLSSAAVLQAFILLW